MGGLPGWIERILVVDDNPAYRRFIKEAFQSTQADPTIRAVETSDNALALLNQQGDFSDVSQPDVVFLDWKLAQTTGEEVLHTAKCCDAPIQVVVMTSSAAKIQDLKSSAPQADLYIEKPTEPDGYIDAVHSVITDT